MTQNKKAQITIAHINDTHSHFEPSAIQLTLPEHALEGTQHLSSDGSHGNTTVYASCGGFARVSTAMKEARKQAYLKGREFLFVHAGDCFQGTLYFSLFKGEANARLLSAVGVEMMALGNHELDMGNTLVADFLDQVNFPMLAGNWDLSQEDQSKRNPLRSKPNLYAYDPETECARYLVKDVQGEPVAIFGLTIENMDKIANPDPDTSFRNVVTVAENTIAALHAKGINKIILLSHLGYERDLELAEQVSGLGVIIGGHTHTMQGDFTNVGYGKKDVYAIQVNETCVVQAGCNALSMGQIHLDFAEDGSLEQVSGGNQLLLGRQFTLDATRNEHLDPDCHEAVKRYLKNQSNINMCAKDPVIEHILNLDYRPAVRERQTNHVADITETLRHVRVPDSRGGSAIAPLVVESFVWQGRSMGYDVDFGIHNAGGVRTSLNPGPISTADIAGRLLPFAIGLMVYKVRGIRIREALEGAIDNAVDNGVEGTGTGSFPYTADLRFTYRCCAPSGHRIEAIEFRKQGVWQPLVDDDVYTSVSSGYTATGKEGYQALLDYEMAPVSLDCTMAEAFEGYAAEQKTLSAPRMDLITYIPCECEKGAA
ncbi:bifunctional metallophosphatase/5'-nucleotidase (plasmid) [Photobacterium sp. GJ3]|uniref:bifunctional metallophosphatase/5'-nucleotidase n=1 Tax=Photobacterium sp. GJ3 TaxID=2829502 RepID=UPI001B8ADAE6|nr:bifunctional UDP-sugar hydrolase/5'-nucleotidase [Photobacterium sp. GJ3]QUJ70411.1 bifunctional metallophosphatase/5'-nucleotidase [Photobacterium sp. GJ3]